MYGSTNAKNRAIIGLILATELETRLRSMVRMNELLQEIEACGLLDAEILQMLLAEQGEAPIAQIEMVTDRLSELFRKAITDCEPKPDFDGYQVRSFDEQKLVDEIDRLVFA